MKNKHSLINSTLDIIDYTYTRHDTKKSIYLDYLAGFSTEEILIKNNHLDIDTIDNIIDCHNYLNV